MLNALLQEELLEVEVKEGFKIENIDSANWCFRKIRAFQQRVNEVNRLADEEVNRIENWRKKENDAVEHSTTYFEMLLSEYYKELRAQDPKAKVSTPYGKITSRKTVKWNYVDEKVLIDFLKENNKELVRVKEEVDKTNLKKTYKDGVSSETGEVLPGVEISNEESISIKVE